MKITTRKAADVVAGDVIEKCFTRFRVIRVSKIKIGAWDAREFLCSPMSHIPGVDTCYLELFADDDVTTWEATEVIS